MKTYAISLALALTLAATYAVAQTGSQSQGAVSPGSSLEGGLASAQLKGQLQSAFQGQPTLSSCNLTANVTDTVIEVAGTCPTGKERQTAQVIARSFAANRRVVDRITVTGRGQVPPQLPQR